MRWFLTAFLLNGLLSANTGAQIVIEPSISDSEKAIAVSALLAKVRETYVFQEKVEDIALAIETRLMAGAYGDIASPKSFSDLLSKDLVDISGDDHFAVIHDPDWIAEFGGQPDSAGAALDDIETLQRSNFGFQKLEILEGNVGYIRFDFFPNPKHSYHAGAAAMKFVENADALILDMRYNRGGYNEFAQFLSSYLFDSVEPQLLLEYSYMADGKIVNGAHRTIAALPGPRRPDIPVYILTSATTFSAGEWFAYSLKKLKRALIVGQQTVGASHAVERKPIDDRFLLQVPVGQVRDPVEKGDFEGVGVVPDYKVESILAAAVAHKLALKTISTRSSTAEEEYLWLLPVLDARIDGTAISSVDLERFAGAYDGRHIEFINGRLVYRWRDRFTSVLTPLTQNLFAIEGVDDFRFRFAEDSGRIDALERVEKGGRVIVYPKL